MTGVPGRCGHVAVHFDNDILVTCGNGINFQDISPHEIWLFNIYTEQWRKHQIPNKQNAPPPTVNACAVVIKRDLYMFGGQHALNAKTNNIWKLSKTPQGCFSWTKSKYENGTKLPAPRCQHASWEYQECLWIFGGSGPFLADSINDYGDFVNEVNNQLLCYKPSAHTGANPQNCEAVPSPRFGHSTMIVKEKVWLFGGGNHTNTQYNDLFYLNMISFTWTQIKTGLRKPKPCLRSSFTAISESQLVLHGGLSRRKEVSDTWVFDISTHKWIQYTPNRKYPRTGHRGLSSVNRSVIIIGGMTNDEQTRSKSLFYVMLEPKRLQQLAAQTIFNNQGQLPLRDLPRKLIAQLGLVEPCTQMTNTKVCQGVVSAVTDGTT